MRWNVLAKVDVPMECAPEGGQFQAAPMGPSIEDRSQVHKTGRDRDIGDVGYPQLVWGPVARVRWRGTNIKLATNIQMIAETGEARRVSGAARYEGEAAC
jgi:hypothetical protein